MINCHLLSRSHPLRHHNRPLHPQPHKRLELTLRYTTMINDFRKIPTSALPDPVRHARWALTLHDIQISRSLVMMPTNSPIGAPRSKAEQARKPLLRPSSVLKIWTGGRDRGFGPKRSAKHSHSSFSAVFGLRLRAERAEEVRTARDSAGIVGAECVWLDY
jgi:hypothetical protein